MVCISEDLFRLFRHANGVYVPEEFLKGHALSLLTFSFQVFDQVEREAVLVKYFRSTIELDAEAGIIDGSLDVHIPIQSSPRGLE